jgi:hypothetical protein
VGSYPWMTVFLAGARRTAGPPRDGDDGLLPPLLAALTAVTGRPARSAGLFPGPVLVATMTGHVVCSAVALAGRRGPPLTGRHRRSFRQAPRTPRSPAA